MLIIFQSKAAADIVMYKKHVRDLFTILNKELEQGIITPKEIQGVLKKIENYIAENNKNLSENVNKIDEDDDIEQYKQHQQVSLSARLYPLIEMLKAADKQQKDIVWGV